MTHISIGRAVGALFLGATAAYIVGSLLAEPALTSAEQWEPAVTALGATLMLLNSAFVVTIGVLAFPVLRRHSEQAALGYLSARVVEAVLLAVGIVFVLLLIPVGAQSAAATVGAGAGDLAAVLAAGNQYAYQLAMIALGAGSILFCRTLLGARLVPRFIAIWGLVGYALLAVGALLELFGLRIGLALSIPGGLFELVLALWLIVKGFPAPKPRELAATGAAGASGATGAPARSR